MARNTTDALRGRVPVPGSAMALAARIAGWDLDPRPLLARPLPEQQWTEHLGVISQQRLTGFLTEAASGGAFPLTVAQREDLSTVHGAIVRRVLELESALVEVVDELTGRGIDNRGLKGAALAHTVYADPTLRLYGDVDVLVRGAQFDDAVAALARMGARRVRAEPRPDFLRRFGKSVALIRPDGISIDLHRALAPGAWAVLMDPDALFASDIAVPVALGRAIVHGLGPVDRFIHACYHATVGSRELHLISLRDVVQTALVPGFDDAAVLERAADWRATTVVALAMDLSWEVLRPAVRPGLLEWAHAHRPGRRDEQLFADRAGIMGMVDMLRAIPGLRGRAAYAGALLWPSADYLAERGQTPLGRLVDGTRLVRGRR